MKFGNERSYTAPGWTEVRPRFPREVIGLYFHESRNPLRRLRCRILGHRSFDITGLGVPICRWCWKVTQ